MGAIPAVNNEIGSVGKPPGNFRGLQSTGGQSTKNEKAWGMGGGVAKIKASPQSVMLTLPFSCYKLSVNHGGVFVIQLL